MGDSQQTVKIQESAPQPEKENNTIKIEIQDQFSDQIQDFGAENSGIINMQLQSEMSEQDILNKEQKLDLAFLQQSNNQTDQSLESEFWFL